jgi:hypothetical protein
MKSLKNIPQGPKPGLNLVAFAAGLKSCPDASCRSQRVFPQSVKPIRFTESNLLRSLKVRTLHRIEFFAVCETGSSNQKK